MSTTSLQWLGQSFFKVHTSEGITLFIDPWKDFAPGNKLFPEGVATDDADLILVTHGHLDHLGDTLSLAKASTKPNFKVVCNFEIMMYLFSLGVPQEKLLYMNKGGTVTAGGIAISMVHAQHSSGIGAFGPTPLLEGGEAAGYMIKLENGGTIYHAGDTDLFGDMALLAERYHPDVALLPIGGVFTMDPETAGLAVKMLHPKAAFPMHYGGTFQLPGTKEAFAEAVQKESPQTTAHTPAPGEVVEIEEYLRSV